MKWGMLNLDDMPNRPSFHPDRNEKVRKGKSYIDGTDYHYFDPWARKRTCLQSRVTVMLLILLVVAGIVAIFWYKVTHQEDETAVYASLGQACFIVGMDTIYQNIAIRLTNQEGHRTDVQFEDALVGKLFIFQFVNNFAPL